VYSRHTSLTSSIYFKHFNIDKSYTEWEVGKCLPVYIAWHSLNTVARSYRRVNLQPHYNTLHCLAVLTYMLLPLN
jgi:hypothetical protein